MKRLFLLLAATCVSLSAMADEGMWMLPYLQKMNIKQMKERGCKLSAEDIYSINESSLKDAIVIFGNGCTGEIVSSQGLLLTNHHCGFGSIQELSSVEHDYLKNGFWAMSQQQELPAPGLSVRFIRKMSDVTPQIMGNVPSTAGQGEYEKIVRENIKALTAQMMDENPGKQVSIESFFEGNQFFAFVIETFNDVRLVGTPPSSIGNFGGDTDNWMWPRHTGDFAAFRVYANGDNQPAAYSPENRPYRAKEFLKVSTKGVKDGDFAMIMGFPGSTLRYITSYQIEEMVEVTNPQRIFVRGERQDILKADMAASDKVRIQYAAKYASSSNYWKNSIGMSRGIVKLGVQQRKADQERAFQQWAQKNTLPEEGYIDALSKIKEGLEGMNPINTERQWLAEAFIRSIEMISPVRSFMNTKELSNPQKGRESFGDWIKDFNPDTDRKVAKRMLKIVRENIKQLPTFYTEIVDKDFGGDSDAYIDYIYDNTLFTSYDKVMELIDTFTPEKVAADPAVPFVKSIMEMYLALSKGRGEHQDKYNEGSRKYVDGLMKQNPTKAWSPDANFTMRLTYGRVLPYDPADGVKYNSYTTLKGVMEKEDANNPVEFFVPEKLKELYAAKDFGSYANAKGELPVAFLADCDITGGNSGSPVLNGRGELIGLAFDGNWEAMSGDVAFEPELQRTIAVDIRYVLFIIDKFAGAKWLVEEMEMR